MLVVFLIILILIEIIRFLLLDLRVHLLIFIINIIRLRTLETDINRLNKLAHGWLFCINRRRQSCFFRNELFFIHLISVFVLVLLQLDFFFCKLFIIFYLLFRAFLLILEVIMFTFVIAKYFGWFFTVRISSVSFF